MPSYAPDRREELAGGIKNALERGENLDQAKKSFLSAGYTPEEVEEATLMLSGTRKATSQVESLSQETPTQEMPTQEISTQEATIPIQKEDGKISKTMIIILVAVGAVILISALVLGLFWDKLF